MKTHLLAALLFAPALNIAHVSAQTVIDVSAPAPDSIIAINTPGPYVLTGSTTENRIIVSPNLSATITLRNVSITSATHSPFILSPDNCNVTLRIEGANTLNCTVPDSGDDGFIFYAGLQVEGSASIIINGSGSLFAQGGVCGAGIGSAWTQNGSARTTGNITIQSGNITATGGYQGAGIGGGTLAIVGNITITGGNITATGSACGAGIGGGLRGTSGTITISGGAINATGGSQAAGIGGGMHCSGGNILISGGYVTANGGGQAAAIGGGGQGTGDGGNILITGGVVLAFRPADQGDPAGIGGGSYANAGTISITGGNVFASGIGGGAGKTDGNITVTGGSIFASGIGICNAALTPTEVSGSGTAIIVGNINVATTDYHSAQVQVGVSLPLTVMQSLAANTPYGTTLHDTTHILHEQRDTLTDTIAVHDTVYLDTALLRDTIHLDTVSVHDTVHIDTVNVYDTIYLDTALLYDTLHADTTELHDTTLIIDTSFIPISIPDTTYLPVSVYDTTHTPAIVIDPSLPPETLLVTDTLFYDRPVDAPTYVLLEDDGGTGVPIPVADNPLTLIPAAGNDLYYINGLDPVAPVLIYTLRGNLVAHAAKMPVRIVGSGVFIVAQGGRYYKVVK